MILLWMHLRLWFRKLINYIMRRVLLDLSILRITDHLRLHLILYISFSAIIQFLLMIFHELRFHLSLLHELNLITLIIIVIVMISWNHLNPCRYCSHYLSRLLLILRLYIHVNHLWGFSEIHSLFYDNWLFL
jgi:hypothetical protein